MDLRNLKQLTIGGVELIQLFINGVEVWKKGFKNWVKYSTESDGTTVYNGGLGYKDGYRIRSGGAEAEHSVGSCTGFIPLKAGDTLRIWPAFTGRNTDNAINFADGSFNNLGQIVDTGTGYGICESNPALYKSTVVDGVSTLTLTSDHDPNIRYVRVTNLINSTIAQIPSGADMIVTVNEEIEVPT